MALDFHLENTCSGEAAGWEARRGRGRDGRRGKHSGGPSLPPPHPSHPPAGRKGFPVAQLIKSLPAVRETWVWFLGWEDLPGKISWRRARLPTPIFRPGEFLGLYSPWAGRKELKSRFVGGSAPERCLCVKFNHHGLGSLHFSDSFIYN